MKRLLLLYLFVFLGINAYGKSVFHPWQYGLREARNGLESYRALLHCHQEAVKQNGVVSYSDIDSIFIEIPRDFVSIPLPEVTDFSGVRLTVTNKQKDCPLFERTLSMTEIDVRGYEIDSGDFSGHQVFKEGCHLLIAGDAEPWCGRRNYISKVVRRDAMIVKNGVSSNRPVSSYCTSSSKPKGWYRRIEQEKCVVKNLHFIRTSESTFKAYCIRLENLCDLELTAIDIYTPADTVKFADAAIHVQNCVNVTMNDIRINGTYSKPHKYGYGISLNNIYNLKVNRMYARSNWGVFGTHCLNNVTLTDCDINRFDIHCYGRDVKAVNCKFSRLYNQFSSVYGKIEYEKCEFIHFIPMLIESSYNAYTPFDLSWKNCTFYLDKNHNYLMTLFGVPEAYNERPELRRKCLPNISVDNCNVVLADDMDKWYLIHTGGVKYKDNFDYITNITMRNIRVRGNKRTKFELSTEQLRTTNELIIVTKIK